MYFIHRFLKKEEGAHLVEGKKGNYHKTEERSEDILFT